MSAPAFLLSAIASGQGKTTASAALARHFIGAGLRVRMFKVGADFLDAMMLERSCGEPVHALDPWMVGTEECARLLEEAVSAADLVLIEGAMGLYDGTPSSADLALEFDLPVLAVIDVQAMAQTVGAVALGLRDFGGVRLAGVIANGIASIGHRGMVQAALREIPLVATLPRQAAALPQRHLGLIPPGESSDIDAHLEALGRSLDLDASVWRSIAAPWSAGSNRAGCPRPAGRDAAAPSARPLEGRQIAIARDAAFAFLYAANIECLETLGAKLVYFSPLAGEPVPGGADAVFLPGGYPELHAERLSGARSFHESIRRAHAARVPILAECGGMMALAESIGDLAGRDWPMAAILEGRTRMQPRLAALGPQQWPTRFGPLRGHTFHYSRMDTALAPAARATTHPRGTSG
ncbi:MAG TPA: cobyrinate a,c-diamide synthase, partial [Acetobacteraceae bacterium]|nr:cobyrinate a,c-diamide synthase [Acetobacteraceae bacterium]